MTVIASGFNANKPISCAMGRYGELIMAQGGGLQPKRWTGGGTATNAGIVAPATAPTIVKSNHTRYYVARTDVHKPGAVYHTAPSVTFTAPPSPPAGFRSAKAQAYLNQSVVSEIRMTDGGKHYPDPPTVVLGNSHGINANLTAVLDGTPPAADSITHCEIIQGPPFDDELEYPLQFRTQWNTWGARNITLTGTGGTLSGTSYVYHNACGLGTGNLASYYPISWSLPYTISGVSYTNTATGSLTSGSATVTVNTTFGLSVGMAISGTGVPGGATIAGIPSSTTITLSANATTTASGVTLTASGTGSGAIIRVNFYGQRIIETNCAGGTAFVLFASPMFVRSATVINPGSGYDPDGAVTVEIPAAVTLDTTTGMMTSTVPSSKKLIIECYPPGHSKNTATPRYSVSSINITHPGNSYVVAPEIKITSPSGFGAYATASVTNGQITAVNLESGGGGYKTPPTVTAVAGGAEAFAVARPHLRGKYQCYYRYVDNTTAANGGPIPSNLSPVTEIDTGEGTAWITWTATAPANTDGRTLTVELWRTTGDQALMLYRVGTGTSLVDDLTDDEVRDPDRAGYAAMPIVLPNGDLNAMRFTPPPNNKSAVVRFQDRFWYGVDTGGSEPNSIYFSEVDEPESVPDINEFVLQQNARDSDAITALAPFGNTLLVMQSRHAFSVSFSKQPIRDANVTPIANRGCLGQRCWDIHAGVCYVMDQYGIYSITPQGDLKDISAPIEDMFRSRIDFANVTWNFVLVDPTKKVLRAFVAFKEDASGGYPTRALCYSIDSNTWWLERYPHRISAGAVAPLTGGDYRPVYGALGGAYLLDEGASDLARGAIATVTVTNKGAGYRTPPTVTVTGGSGGELRAVINASGQVSGIWIVNPGYGYTSGSLTLSAPDDPNCAAPVQATATFTATTNASDTSLSPVYRYKTGNRAFPTDMTAKGGGSAQPRDISVTYKPQPSACDLAVRLYYNNSPHARPNVANRNRGVGFTASAVDGASRLNMGAQTAKTGYDTGVAKASFASRSIDDIQSADRHVAVEMIGARRTAEPVVIYTLDVYGTANASGG